MFWNRERKKSGSQWTNARGAPEGDDSLRKVPCFTFLSSSISVRILCYIKMKAVLLYYHHPEKKYYDMLINFNFPNVEMMVQDPHSFLSKLCIIAASIGQGHIKRKS